LNVAVSDQADGEAEDGFVDVVASFPADARAAEAMQPGDGAFPMPVARLQPLTMPAWPPSARTTAAPSKPERCSSTSTALDRKRSAPARGETQALPGQLIQLSQRAGLRGHLSR
jgi:hypothetical protein